LLTSWARRGPSGVGGPLQTLGPFSAAQTHNLEVRFDRHTAGRLARVVCRGEHDQTGPVGVPDGVGLKSLTGRVVLPRGEASGAALLRQGA